MGKVESYQVSVSVENTDHSPRGMFRVNMAARLATWDELMTGIQAAGQRAKNQKEYREHICGIADALVTQAVALYHCGIADPKSVECAPDKQMRFADEIADIITKRIELNRDRKVFKGFLLIWCMLYALWVLLHSMLRPQRGSVELPTNTTKNQLVERYVKNNEKKTSPFHEPFDDPKVMR